MAQRQENFFGPVIEALVARQNILAQRQAQEQRQQEIELRKKALEQQAKRDAAILKQAEASDKIKRLQQGQELFALKEARINQLTGTSKAPAERNIPGAGEIQTQPLLENILQRRGLASELPQTGVTVRGKESAPVNLDIPNLEGGTQLSLPLGTTQELLAQRLANQATRRSEEERQLQLAGQSELLKSRSRAAGAFPFQQLLEETKQVGRGSLEDKRITARALEGEKNRQNRIATALIRLKNQGVENAAEIADASELVGLGIRDFKDFSIKNRPAITSALKAQGFNVPSKSAIGVIEQMGQFPVMLEQFDNILKDITAESSASAALSGGIKKLQNVVIPEETIVKINETAAGLAGLIRSTRGEKGPISDKDIERAKSLLPDVSLPKEANARRRKLLLDAFESAANVGLSSVPKEQRKAIFEHYGVPFTARDINEKTQTESAPSNEPKILNDGKVVEYNGKKYGVGETFTVGGKRVKWIIENGVAIPVEVQ